MDSVKESAKELVRYNGDHYRAWVHANKMLAFHTNRFNNRLYRWDPGEVKLVKDHITHLAKVVAELSRQSIKLAMEQTRMAHPRSRKSPRRSTKRRSR